MAIIPIMCNSERWQPSVRGLTTLRWILSIGAVAVVVQAIRFFIAARAA